jgi:hypothetical protein
MMAAFEAISTINVSSSTASVTFSSIPQIYKNLQIRGLARCTTADGGGQPRIRINGDTGNSYHTVDQRVMPGFSTTTYYTTVSNSVSAIAAPDYSIPDTIHPSNIFGFWNFEIADYTASSKRKGIVGICGMAANTGGNRLGQFAGHYNGTGAITSITLYFANSGANISAGSVFALYGFGV